MPTARIFDPAGPTSNFFLVTAPPGAGVVEPDQAYPECRDPVG
jgi:hypothetical protein